MRKRNFVLPVTKDNAKTAEKMLVAMTDNWRSSDVQFARALLQVQSRSK